MKKVAAIIPSFNMPERTNALTDYISHHCNDVEIITVDNGSDHVHRLEHPQVALGENVQTTAGWLMGLHYADCLERKYKGKFSAYWFIITSAEFTDESKDPLAPMVAWLDSHYDAVGCHPALTEDSTTSWTHMKAVGTGFRQTWMIDNICALYKADWFNSIGRFDPTLEYAWGVDLESCWKARSSGNSLWICDNVKVKKVTDVGYTMNRMGMDAEQRRTLARANMDEVFTERYGANWRKFMMEAENG